MAETRDELRDHLIAVIEAARELPPEDRTYFADTFLDELDRQYQLVPRSGPRPVVPSTTAPAVPVRRSVGWPAPGALLFLLPILFVIATVGLHVPFLFLGLVFWLVFRGTGVGMGRGRGGSWPGGPRGGLSRSNF